MIHQTPTTPRNRTTPTTDLIGLKAMTATSLTIEMKPTTPTTDHRRLYM